ncbi:YHS domain-containing protein [Thalassotalea euphylliae]|uniref:YHS domain-containing protein n=2 Tax=Thalassotalea euphylliae TaxID=1655234 RepID=A0A3E0TSM7_9GAMM|nr:YHS domain-containing protein [Thalassotalea euphylliae]
MLFALLLTACATVPSTPVLTLEGAAIGGYDVVAYQTEEKAVKGNEQFTSLYNESVWRFASAENKAKFDADPVKYAPQYGGYCAYGLSNGFIIDSDPEAFSLVDGKLYLNNTPSVRDTWLENTSYYISNADVSWEKAKAKAAKK